MKFLLFLTVASHLPLWSSAIRQLATIPETPSTVIDILRKAHYRKQQVHDDSDATKELYQLLDTEPTNYEELPSIRDTSINDILILLGAGANSQTFLKGSTLSMPLEKNSANPMASFYWAKAKKWWTEDTATRSFPNNKHINVFGLLLAYNAQALADLPFTKEDQHRIAYHACAILARCSHALNNEQLKSFQYIITTFPQATMPSEDLPQWCVTSAIKDYNYDIAQKLLAKCPSAAPLPLVINCALRVLYHLENNKKNNSTCPPGQRSIHTQLAMLAVLAAHYPDCLYMHGEQSVWNRLTQEEQEKLKQYKIDYQKNSLGQNTEVDESRWV